MSTRLKLILLAVVALLLVGGGVVWWQHRQGSLPTVAIDGRVGPAELYPDSTLSPGDVDPDATEEKVCTPGYTDSVRDVSASTKNQVFERYHISEDQRYTIVNGRKRPNYEVDHIISLELGGSNSIKNLFPERYEPRPGAHEKDMVENWLHYEVCVTHSMTLQQAQQAIITDWYKIYLDISSRPKGHRH